MLDKKEQQCINGGMNGELHRECSGTGEGGGYGIGHSSACVGYEGRCSINGYDAGCNGRGGFWYY